MNRVLACSHPVYQPLLNTRIIDLYVCMSISFSVALTLCFTDQCIPNSYVDCISPMTLGFLNYKAQSTDRVLDTTPPLSDLQHSLRKLIGRLRYMFFDAHG